MLKRWNGSAWQDAGFLRRWNGSAWQDSIMQRWNGSAWQKVFPAEQTLYEKGDQKTAVTGGWTRKVISWLMYNSGNRDAHIDLTENYIEVKTRGYDANFLPSTVNPVDITNYSKINILYDFMIYQSNNYNNGMSWGVVNGPMTWWYDDHNPPWDYCNGYANRIVQCEDMRFGDNRQWFTDRTSSIDISDLTGNWYPLICPWSWSWYSDETTVRIKKVWLS